MSLTPIALLSRRRDGVPLWDFVLNYSLLFFIVLTLNYASLNRTLLSFPVFELHINGIILCVHPFVSGFFCLMLLPVAV